MQAILPYFRARFAKICELSEKAGRATADPRRPCCVCRAPASARGVRDQAAFGSFAPSTSPRSMTGGDASRFGACAISARAIGPLRWVCRPASSTNASKTPNVDGPMRSANQTGVVGSWRASSRPRSRNAATSASFPGLASRRTSKLRLGIVDLLLACGGSPRPVLTLPGLAAAVYWQYRQYSYRYCQEFLEAFTRP